MQTLHSIQDQTVQYLRASARKFIRSDLLREKASSSVDLFGQVLLLLALLRIATELDHRKFR